MKLRPGIGRSDNDSVSSVSWLRVSATLTSGVAPLTVTVSSSAPTSSVSGRFSVWLVCSVTVFSARLNPCASAVTLYEPGARLRNR